jgi:spore germination cell wall hydrolase CwlJ-like protein
MIELAAVCLALNIYFEARSEPVGGQIAVAQVTMRRATYNTDKVCEVVLAHKQFSWLNGKTKKKGNMVLAAFEQPKDKKAWKAAKKTADLVLKKQAWDHSKGATFYHTKKVNPKWNRKMKVVAVIGNHIFYKAA